DRGLETLHGHWPQRVDHDVTLGEPQGALGDEDGTRPGDLLHAGGQVRGLADSRVVHAQVGPDRADDDLARIEAHADLDWDATGALRLIDVTPDALLHPKRGVTRPHRVILVGQRGAEEGHDAVAHHLVHGALVAVDGLHHQLENGIQELVRLLRIAVGEKLHRALQVRE